MKKIWKIFWMNNKEKKKLNSSITVQNYCRKWIKKIWKLKFWTKFFHLQMLSIEKLSKKGKKFLQFLQTNNMLWKFSNFNYTKCNSGRVPVSSCLFKWMSGLPPCMSGLRVWMSAYLDVCVRFGDGKDFIAIESFTSHFN